MEYTIRQLADLAGVTTRTLRWYDQTGLLRPARVAANGYRLYGRQEVDRLQQILFYRALGVDLRRVGAILDDPSFDRLEALRGHLSALRAEQMRIGSLIETVQKTIQTEERNELMSDTEKFEVFKRQVVEGNEARYGKETRLQYGDAAVEEANQKVLGLTQEVYARWQSLGDAILERLEAAINTSADPAGEAGRAITALHREWLCCSMPYDPQKHRGLAELYVADPRFTAYYDRNVSGCAAFLRAAVLAWVEAE